MNLALDSILAVLYLNPPDRHYDLEFAPDGTGICTQGDLPLAEYHEKDEGRNRLAEGSDVLPPAGYGRGCVCRKARPSERAIPFCRHNLCAAGRLGFLQHGRRPAAQVRVLPPPARWIHAGLADEHPNVFLSDLADYQPISALGRQVYMDPRHLTREGIFLLRALEPEIKAALEWARDNRQVR